MARKRVTAAWRITQVEASNYDSKNRANRSRVENPSWGQVRDAILSLDANKRSDLAVSAADGAVLAVGGGRGRYHVYVSYPEGSSHASVALVDPSRGDREEILIVGRVETPLPARMVVSEAVALRAARRFFEDGCPEPAFAWEPC